MKNGRSKKREAERMRYRMGLYPRRRRRRERARSGCAELVMLLLVVLICVFCAAIRAEGNEAQDGHDREAYRELEREYRDEVSDVLARHRLSDSGINLTSVIRPDGEREYRLDVHHARIGKMTRAQREALAEGLRVLSFPDGVSAVCISLSF